MHETNSLIIGASISGLASAACLSKNQVDYIIIEKQDQVIASWRQHYDRLHLHTNKRGSHLPYKHFGKKIPRYPSRQQVIEYLDDYQKTFNILPVLNTEALSVKRNGQHWFTETNHGPYQSNYLIMATGAFSKPKPIAFRGMETFQGKILHSSAYKTGRDFKGQKVLVVGFGNSACEIAIDLYEQGATPAMAVRSPVNVIPRDIFGIPILELSLALNPLPPKMADAISAPLIHWLVGDLTKLGLSYMPYGPLEEIRKDGNAPVLDIGTIKHIREGHISIYDDIEEIAGNTIHFKNGKKDIFNAIVAAIGYYRDYADFLKVDKSRFEDLRMPMEKQQYFGQDGLYFCGYWISPTGQIREIASDAEKIAKDIKKREGF